MYVLLRIKKRVLIFDGPRPSKTHIMMTDMLIFFDLVFDLAKIYPIKVACYLCPSSLRSRSLIFDVRYYY